MNHINYFALGKYTFVLICVLSLFGCKSTTDVEYNEMNAKFSYMCMGYSVAISWFANTLDKQTDVTQGRKYIHKEDKNLTPSEIEKLNVGITYVEFTPTEKEITDAIALINKINNVKPLVIKMDSICKHSISFYIGGQKLKRINQIIKHPKSSYTIMDKDFEEIRMLDKEIRVKLGMSLSDFLIQNDKQVKVDAEKNSVFFSILFPSLN
jgi:hypothetical protein